MQTFGLIPAAGKSVRMGQPKLLLPINGKPVLTHVLQAMRDGGVTKTLVVVGPGATALAEIAAQNGAHVLELAEETPDMRATCQHGLVWLEDTFRPADQDGWLLLPADHPTVHPEIVRALIGFAEDDERSDVFVPVYNDRRGHPTWIRWRLTHEIRALADGQGLNTLVRNHLDRTREIAWHNDEVLIDLDTPEDYARLIG